MCSRAEHTNIFIILVLIYKLLHSECVCVGLGEPIYSVLLISIGFLCMSFEFEQAHQITDILLNCTVSAVRSDKYDG